MAFCSNCGAKLDAGARFCPECGTSVEVTPKAGTPAGAESPQPSPQQVQQPAQPAPQQAPQPTPQQAQQPAPQPAPRPVPQSNVQVDDTQKYKTLGGWLLFFLICWGISALRALLDLVQYLRMIAYFGIGYVQPAFGSILVDLVSIGLSVIMIVLIVQRHPKFLRIYQILTIVNIALSLLVTVPLAFSLGSTNAAPVLAAGFAGTVLGGVVGLVLMTMYFCKSVRVRTYMESTEYLDNALFKIGV